MRTMRMSLAALAALVFAIGTMIATEAFAGIRVDAIVHTPVVSVRIGNTPPCYRPAYPLRPLPPRRYTHRRMDARDVGIARRLAWYTGLPPAELLRYRRYGYGWYEIGRWLHVREHVVRAALSERGWDRFLRRAGYYAAYYGPRGYAGMHGSRYECGR